MNIGTPRIIHGVPGPSGEPGILLLVPPSEALDWDLKDEVATTARYWMADRQAWWVAASYASTAAAIVARVYGPNVVVEGFERLRGGAWRFEGGRSARAAWRRQREAARRARLVVKRLRERFGTRTL